MDRRLLTRRIRSIAHRAIWAAWRAHVRGDEPGSLEFIGILARVYDVAASQVVNPDPLNRTRIWMPGWRLRPFCRVCGGILPGRGVSKLCDQHRLDEVRYQTQIRIQRHRTRRKLQRTPSGVIPRPYSYHAGGCWLCNAPTYVRRWDQVSVCSNPKCRALQNTPHAARGTASIERPESQRDLNALERETISTCPECGGRVVKIRYEMVCESCGLVA